MFTGQAVALSTLGTITVNPDGSIVSDGFSADGCSCREVAVLSALWAIEQLQRELVATLHHAGGGKIGIA